MKIDFKKIKTVLLINPPIVETKQFFERNSYLSQPVGLLKIASFLKAKKKKIILLDCMENTSIKSENRKKLNEIAEYEKIKQVKIGNKEVPLFLVGKNYKEVENRIRSYKNIDLVLVTSGLTYHYKPLHSVIEICKKIMPKVPVVLGGIYATLCPIHAEKSKADFIYKGEFYGASSYQSDLSLYKKTPDYAVIKFTKGCPNKCSYCAVHKLEGSRFMLTISIKDVIKEILYKRNRYGIDRFVFFESNILADARYFEQLLDEIIEKNLRINIYFPEGFASNLLTSRLIKKMKRAGIEKINVSIEESSNERITGLNRTILLETHERAIQQLKEEYPPGEIIVHFLVNLPKQTIRDVVKGIVWCWERGVCFAPKFFTPIPSTEEYKKYDITIEKKDLQDLHPHLFLNEENELSVEDLEKIFKLRDTNSPFSFNF